MLRFWHIGNANIPPRFQAAFGNAASLRASFFQLGKTAKAEQETRESGSSKLSFSNGTKPSQTTCNSPILPSSGDSVRLRKVAPHWTKPAQNRDLNGYVYGFTYKTYSKQSTQSFLGSPKLLFFNNETLFNAKTRDWHQSCNIMSASRIICRNTTTWSRSHVREVSPFYCGAFVCFFNLSLVNRSTTGEP